MRAGASFKKGVTRVFVACAVMLASTAGASVSRGYAIDIDGVSLGMSPEEVNESLGFYQLTKTTADEYVLKLTEYRADDVHVFSSRYMPGKKSVFSDISPVYRQKFLGIFSKETNKLFSFQKVVEFPEESSVLYEDVINKITGEFGPPAQECFNEDFGAHFAYWGYSVKDCPTFTPPDAVPDDEVVKVAYKEKTVYIILVDGKTDKALRR